jgi:3-hydroxy-9,10-secoandrosta-1,3,5(10)-triene-9,17-dione monooxygenase
MILRNDVDLSKKMTYEEAVARARSLAPAIAEHAAAAEVQRHLPEEIVQAIVEAGLVRLLTPARWGGHELGFSAYVDSTLEMAKADASVGWCYSFFVMHSWMLAQFSEKAQRDVWESNPDALITTSFVPIGRAMPPANGGYILNGNWPWSSGVDYSSWCILGGLLPPSGDTPPEPALFLVPRSDYEILDTWFVAGLKASGSKNVLLKEVFVPEHRVVRLLEIRDGGGPGTTVNPGRLYSLPFFTANAPGFVAPIVGATLGAYETWRQTNSNKLTAFTREQVAMLSHVQIRLAEIEAKIQTARLFLQATLDGINSSHSLSLEQRFHYMRDIGYIAKVCVEAVERIFLASGGSANYETHPLQRYWRDIHAMAAHASLNFDASGENFGRMELGLPHNSHTMIF